MQANISLQAITNSKHESVYPELLPSTQRRATLKLASDTDLLMEYRLKTADSDYALAELLSRHNGMLRKLAWKMAIRYTHIASFEDFMQHAYVGAMISYNRFDVSKASAQGTKLSTYVHRTVENHLHTSADLDAPIYCPTQQRGMRSYLGGKYDGNPAQKQKFEKENGLTTDEARDVAKDRYRALKQDLVSLDYTFGESTGTENSSGLHDVLVDHSVISETSLIDRFNLDCQISKLTPRQQRVCQLVMEEEFTTKECAQILGVTPDAVRGDLRTIREQMKSMQQAELNELKALGIR